MSNSTVYLDKIYSKDGNTEIVDTVNRSVKAKTIELGGNIIASHSGVEGAGTVTLQNATLDSNVVFPAGHVIQTVRSTKSGSSNSTASTTFAKVKNSDSEYYYATINNVLANSKVLITTRFLGRFDKTSNNAGGEFGLYRDSTIILGQSTLSSPVNYYLHVNVTDTDHWIPQTIIFLDESPATGTNNYYLGYGSYGSTSVQVLGYIDFEMILMEIAE